MSFSVLSISTRLRVLVVSMVAAVVAALLPAGLVGGAAAAAPSTVASSSSGSTGAGLSATGRVVAAAGPESKPSQRERVESLSTEVSRTFREPDGSYTTETYAEPVNFQDQRGRWRAIDNDLEPTRGPQSESSRFAYENAANEFTVKIPRNPSAAPVRMAQEGVWVSLQMRGVADRAVEVSGSRARVEQVQDARRVDYRVVSTGIQEDIVLGKAPARPVSWTYTLNMSQDLTPRLRPDGSVGFFRTDGVGVGAAAGEPVLAMPAGTMLDSAAPVPAESGEVEYTLEQTGSRWQLTATPDEQWLTSAERVYPVTVDAALSNQPSRRDCWIRSEQPNRSHCGRGSKRLRVGRIDADTRRRILLDFDISMVPPQARITHAHVKLWMTENLTIGEDKQAEYGLYRAGKRWNNAATWNTSGASGRWNAGDPTGRAYGKLPLSGKTSSYRYFEDIEPIVQAWHEGSRPNHGMVLKQIPESTNNMLGFYSASETNRQDRTPAMSIRYDLPTPDAANGGDRGFWNYVSRSLSDSTTAKVNIGNGNLLLTEQDASLAGVAGWDLVLTRYYNSAAAQVGVANMGAGWSSAFGGSVRLTFPEAGRQRVYFWGPSGYRARFENPGSDDKYDRMGAGIKADLEYQPQSGSGGPADRYVLTFFDESKYYFDADGTLLKSQDAAGNTLDYAYGNQRLQTVTDTRGRTAELAYDADGLVSSVTMTNPAGEAMLRWAYTYDGATPARMASARLEMIDNQAAGGTYQESPTSPTVGATTTYDYDAQHRLTRVTVPHGHSGQPGDEATTEVAYDANTHRVASLTRVNSDPDAEDSTTGFTYFDLPRAGGDSVCKNKDLGPETNAVARTHVDGERTDVADVTEYCIDYLDRILRTEDATGKQRGQSFTSNSNVATSQMPGISSGVAQHSYSYDANDNPTQATTPEGSTISASYGTDPASDHSPTSVSSSNSGGATDQWLYDYDDENNLIRARSLPDAAGGDPGVEYRYCWTPTGQIRRIDPVTATGNRSNSTNPQPGGACNADAAQGNDTRFSYNNQGELVEVDKPAGGDVTYTYDNLSRIATVTDARGVTTRYAYDGRDRVVEATYTGNGQTQTITWGYDQAGNQTRLSDGNGENTFDYDDLNRRTRESGQGPAPATTYAYDPAGNLVEQTVPGRTVGGQPAEATTYAYDKLNRLKALDDPRPGNSVIGFDYDNQDNRRLTVWPGADGEKNLAQLARYDNDSEMTCVFSYRGTTGPTTDTTTEADQAPAVGSTCQNASAAGLVTFRDYDYDHPDRGGIRTSMIHTVTELGGKTTHYDYDSLDRLDDAETTTGRDPDSTTLRRYDYTYDRHSNPIREKTTGTTPGLQTGNHWRAFNPGDEICTTLTRGASNNTKPDLGCGSGQPAGATSYTHDGAGNLTTATGGGTGTLAGLNLAHNLPGQTTAITPPGGGTTRDQAYDGVMQDRRTTSGPTSMSYGYNGLTSQNTSGSDAHAEIFVRTPGGELLAMIDTGTGEARYYLTDHQQSIVATTTPTPGTDALVRYLYEPYGQTIRSWTDTNPDDPDNGSENTNLTTPAVDYNPWRYASGYRDESTGFLKFGTRYYIPTLATWTQADPKNGHLNSPLSMTGYSYSGGDPVNKSDRTGRSWTDVTMSASWCGAVAIGGCVSLNLAEGGDFSLTGSLGYGLTGGPSFYPAIFGDNSGDYGEYCAAFYLCVQGGLDSFGLGIGTPGIYEQETSFTIIG